jgi:CheY-like chemotaxis protein
VGYHGTERRTLPRAIPILVVDDNPDFLRLLQLWFGLCGFAVTTATNGVEAVDAASRVAPHVVLMDLAMPVLDGLAATERLRAHPQTAAVPILAVTATVSERARQRAREVGMDAFVEKPVDIDRLVEIVRGFLRARRRV